MMNLMKETPINMVLFNQHGVTKGPDIHILAKQIDVLVKSSLDRRSVAVSEEKDIPQNLRFIQPPLLELESSLETLILPEINRFKRALIGFKFKSPLNFIMIGNGFHDFFSMFYHSKLLTQYLTNFVTDSVFSLHALHVQSLPEGE